DFALAVVSDDEQLALVQALAHRRVDEDEAQLLARHEVEAVFAVELLGQLVLLDERLDLEGAGLGIRRLLALLVELRIGRGLRGRGLIGGALLLGNRRRFPAQLRFWLLLRVFRRTHLFLGDETGFEQLLAQGGAHVLSPKIDIDWRQASYTRPLWQCVSRR